MNNGKAQSDSIQIPSLSIKLYPNTLFTLFNPTTRTSLGSEFKITSHFSIDLSQGFAFKGPFYNTSNYKSGSHTALTIRYYPLVKNTLFYAINLRRSTSMYSELSSFDFTGQPIAKMVDIQRRSKSVSVLFGANAAVFKRKWPLDIYLGIGLEQRNTTFPNLNNDEIQAYQRGEVDQLKDEKLGASLNLRLMIGFDLVIVLKRSFSEK